MYFAFLRIPSPHGHTSEALWAPSKIEGLAPIGLPELELERHMGLADLAAPRDLSSLLGPCARRL